MTLEEGVDCLVLCSPHCAQIIKIGILGVDGKTASLGDLQ